MPEHGSNWRDLAADLPAPRDDEPSHLRDDIVAELADHLSCAMNRELHATGDKEHAKKNVIDKFGNPTAVAYRLWWDAIKEKIMSQRILIGVTVIMAIACLAASGFAWMAVQEGREVNRAMLEKLSSLTLMSEEHPQSLNTLLLDWVPVKVKLVSNEHGMVPDGEFQVTLFGKLFGTDNVQVDKKLHINEEVEIGYVKPGSCTLTVNSPWGDHTTDYQTIMPGTPRTLTVDCPSKPIEDVQLKLDVNWPADLRNENLDLICAVSQGLRHIGETVWQPPLVQDRQGFSGTTKRDWLLLQSSGKVANYWSTIGYAGYNIESIGQSKYGIETRLDPDSELMWKESLTIRNLPVEINGMTVVFPSTELLALRMSKKLTISGMGMPIISTWPTDRYFRGDGELVSGQMPEMNGIFQGPIIIPIKSAIVDKSADPLRFVPKAGEINVWTIELPESLVARTREALKALDEFKAERNDSVEARYDGE
ncbi:MAG: hypothetical protein O2955_19795 [Planctomycetota bacterium]|nr:hypothetical protein [Planctomycetota bacterium]MDA1214758.1 hypothetical protein [Planctomycetota bacterium]